LVSFAAGKENNDPQEAGCRFSRAIAALFSSTKRFYRAQSVALKRPASNYPDEASYVTGALVFADGGTTIAKGGPDKQLQSSRRSRSSRSTCITATTASRQAG